MKHTLFIFAILTATIQAFAQSPRIKLNQITKDSVTGSVLISSPTDSGMVYSRDLFISYGADTVLILGGDTLAATSGIISSVLSDGVTITGDGTVGSPLTVDTATVVATKQDLDLYYLDSNPDGYTSNTGTVTSVAATAGTGISVMGSPITTSGTLTITNTAPDQTVSIAGGGINAVTGTYPSFTVTGTEVDGSVTNEIQDITTTGAAGNISISSGSTLNLNVDDSDASATNEGSLTVGAGTASTSIISSNTSGSTDVTLTAGTNVTLSETGNNITISATGGGGSIPVDTFVTIAGTETITGAKTFTSALTQSGGDVNFDSGTFFVDESTNRVGIGTTSPSEKLEVNGDACFGDGCSTLQVNRSFNVMGSGGVLKVHRNTGVGAGYEMVVGTDSIATGSNNYFWDMTLKPTGYLVYRIKNNLGNTTVKEAIALSPDAEVFMDYLPAVDATSDGNVEIDISNGKLFRPVSSIRYKTNIKPYDKGINILMKLQPSYFDYKSSGLTSTGFIAEQVYDAGLEEAVFNNKEGNIEGINEKKFTPLIVKAIQEQQAIIESQATEIETLKSQIQLILQEIEQIKNN